MKLKYLYVLIAVLLVVLFIVYFITTSKTIKKKFITINSHNTYLIDENQYIELYVYVNDGNFPIDDPNSFLSSKVLNNDSTKLLTLELVDVTFSHTEKYRNEIFYKYFLKFKMPDILNDFSIEDAILEITFIDNKVISLNIGEFHLIYYENTKDLDWSKLESKKNKINDVEINSIYIELNQDLKDIEYLKINTSENLRYEFHNNILIIYLNKKNIVQTYFPIIIKDSNQVYILSNIHHSQEFNLLENSERNINLYEFD